MNRERRTGYGRRESDDICPITPECAEKILGRLDVVETKVTELHEKLIQARGFVTGMRFGAASLFVFLATFAALLVGLLTGKVSLKDIFSGLF